MFKKPFTLFLLCFLVLNFLGCASVPGPTAKAKELKLKWNVSYLRGLVLVQSALKEEPVKFEKAVISKQAARLKGNYNDGQGVEIVISKISNSESSVAVNAGSSLAAKEQAQRILQTIAEYAQKPK